jgi:hypothetical protein
MGNLQALLRLSTSVLEALTMPGWAGANTKLHQSQWKAFAAGAMLSPSQRLG